MTIFERFYVIIFSVLGTLFIGFSCYAGLSMAGFADIYVHGIIGGLTPTISAVIGCIALRYAWYFQLSTEDMEDELEERLEEKLEEIKKA